MSMADSSLGCDHDTAAADFEKNAVALCSRLEVATRELLQVSEKLRLAQDGVIVTAEELRCNYQELQAVKLTLQAVNAELQAKLCRLDETVADLDRLSRVSGEPRIYLDAQLHLLRVAAEASALFRFQATDVGRRITDFNHQLDYPDLESDLLAALESGEPRHREVGDRLGRCWLVTLQPLTLPGPGKPRLVMTCIDVSSQRHLLQLQRVVDALAGYVVVLDAHGLVKLVNRAWREAYASYESYDCAEGSGVLGICAHASGDNYLDACRSDATLDDHDIAHLVSGLHAVLAGSQQAFTGVYPSPAPDAQRWFLMHVAPMVDGYCVVTHLNLTELAARHAIELAPARETADLAKAAKHQFLTHVSHELRTPMNGIMGMTHLALGRATDPQQIDFLKKSMEASRHLLAVISDILDISRIEATRLTLDEADFSPEQVIDDILQMLGPSARAKGLELSRMTQPMPELVHGDALRLRQILHNLVGNAIKFSERGRVTVAARVVEHDGDDLVLRLDVIDQGIGISCAQQQGLFQSFFQADSSSTRRYGGMGLGLAIAKRLANLMGGDVGVISESGMGSTFWATARFRLGKGCGKIATHNRAA
jgi:signal transduction histidine kinase/PAS domain-containing protein